MKNIVLMGPTRSGKTTFAKMILKEYNNYNLICTDAIADAYNATCKKFNNKFDINFTHDLDVEIFKMTCERENKLNFILDALHIEFDDLKELQKDKNNIIILFGYPNISYEDKIKSVFKYENEDDWTSEMSSAIIMQLIHISIEDSKIIRDFAKENNFKYVDTSYNRNKVLKELMIWLKDKIN